MQKEIRLGRRIIFFTGFALTDCRSRPRRRRSGKSNVRVKGAARSPGGCRAQRPHQQGVFGTAARVRGGRQERPQAQAQLRGRTLPARRQAAGGILQYICKNQINNNKLDNIIRIKSIEKILILYYGSL